MWSGLGTGIRPGRMVAFLEDAWGKELPQGVVRGMGGRRPCGHTFSYTGQVVSLAFLSREGEEGLGKTVKPSGTPSGTQSRGSRG